MPPGTQFCLQDKSDFPAGTSITVPGDHDFRVGDPVVFKEEGIANIDSALTSGTTYYVVAKTANSITVSATDGGRPITLNGDGGSAATTGPIATLGTVVGGTGYVDGTYNAVPLTGGTGTGATANITVTGTAVTAVTIVAAGTGYTAGDTLSAASAALSGAGALVGGGTGTGFTVPVATITATKNDTVGGKNHINVAYAAYQSVCQAREFSLSLSRESLDVTTLPCGVSPGGGKYASFRATQAGYASGEGSVSVYFTSDKKTMANRLLGATMLKSQLGAWVKLYINTVDDGTGKPKDVDSLYIEAPVSITGMSFSVNPDDAITAELSFTINGQPKHLFDLDL